MLRTGTRVRRMTKRVGQPAPEGKIIGKGIMREIKSAVGTGAGCIHLRELATEVVNFTATCLLGYENGYGLMSPEFNRFDENQRYRIGREKLAGTCHVYQGGAAPGEARGGDAGSAS